MDFDQMKITWQGEVVSIQPRSTVWRYLTDNRTHRECGFNIFLKGTVYDSNGCPIQSVSVSNRYDFCIAVSEKQEQKMQIQIGDELKGSAWTKKYPETEFADFIVPLRDFLLRSAVLQILQDGSSPIRSV